ncbi:acetolactate synthase large subunit [Halieaceae bacterium IMCC14734]|uniref:Acetolactate synthase large subunit n=1 Tax=Candidatus Litorirhabdus singularis TaxID=2518993 RepID=A0ABT3TMH3_9GAMM|nr:acetolactate synthase large subunit [Candidatus Litorirhabdus singularis]MCX2982955.1 acetolactate synthase large subunit [Candidatus Litorirhabdus singularis]
MNGAESLLSTLVNNEIEVCFTNPGTSEMHFVAALDEVDGMRCVLCLFEGVLSGAADGYARMARKPASTLLHLGPGLGNALANLHNAGKGHVPVVNIVGDHASYHLQYNAPLTSDITAIAGAVSDWTHTANSSAEIASDAAEAVRQAGFGSVATLILPADVSWGDNPNGAVAKVAIEPPTAVAEALIEDAVSRLQSGANCMLMIGGREIDKSRGLLINQIAKATGARVCSDVFPTRVARGAGTAVIERLPYLAELAIDHLKDIQQLILIGAAAPVSFFAYPGVPSAIAPDACEQLQLATPDNDIDRLLAEIARRVGAIDIEPEVYPLQLPPAPVGALDVNSAAQALAYYLPEEAVVVDESITAGMAIFPQTMKARAHDWLHLSGGSIGWGLPASVGAAIACPRRKVICLEGDGSAMYTIQALWTMAREDLDVLVIIFNNRKYSVLEMEFARTGARGGSPGVKAASTLGIGSPDMDFVALATGMGVSAERADSAEAFCALLEQAMSERGPRLIDAIVPSLF